MWPSLIASGPVVRSGGSRAHHRPLRRTGREPVAYFRGVRRLFLLTTPGRFGRASWEGVPDVGSVCCVMLFTFEEPDGSQIRLLGWGNQFEAVFETLDGYTV